MLQFDNDPLGCVKDLPRFLAEVKAAKLRREEYEKKVALESEKRTLEKLMKTQGMGMINPTLPNATISNGEDMEDSNTNKSKKEEQNKEEQKKEEQKKEEQKKEEQKKQDKEEDLDLTKSLQGFDNASLQTQSNKVPGKQSKKKKKSKNLTNSLDLTLE